MAGVRHTHPSLSPFPSLSRLPVLNGRRLASRQSTIFRSQNLTFATCSSLCLVDCRWSELFGRYSEEVPTPKEDAEGAKGQARL
jgi:hypothetical protein